jgi:hypothetical protein
VSASYKAGAIYFTVVFCVAFLLGVFRIFVLVPRFGTLIAVLCELPVMLSISWVVCRWIVDSLSIPAKVMNRTIMGGVAFVLLMIAELSLSLLLFNRTISGHFALYKETPELLGLIAQVLFSALPILQLMQPRDLAKTGHNNKD